MAKRTRILIVGGGNVETAPDGELVTKTPIAGYLHEMADHFGHCVWIAQRSGTWGVSLDQPATELTGRIDSARVTVVPINAGLRGTLVNWFLFLRYAIERPHAVLFLPACGTLAPLLPLVRLILKRSAAYVANDYQAYAEEPDRPRWFGWKFLFVSSYEMTMRYASFVIARGSFLAKIAATFNSRVIETVPLGHILGAEPNEIRELREGEERRILYIGLLVQSKGMEDLLKALRLIKDHRPAARVVLEVLGEGPDRDTFESLTEELGLADSVRFHGWVEEEDEMNAHFRAAHCLVMPSSTHPEGVPRSIDEALIRLIPVVATRIAGVPDEFSGGEARLVDTCSPEQIAEATQEVLFDHEARAAAIEGARRRRNKWTAFRSAADQHAKYLLGELPLE